MAEAAPLLVGVTDNGVDAWRLAIFQNPGDSVDQALKFSAGRVAEAPKVLGFDLSDPVLRTEANQKAEHASARGVSGAYFVGQTIQPVMCVQAVAVLLCFASSLAMCLYGVALSECDEERVVHALPFSTWGLIFLAFLMARLYCEFICLRRFLIPFSQMVRTFKTMDFECGFSVWLLHGLLLSVSMALSQTTQGLIVALWVYGEFTCPSPEIDRVQHAIVVHTLPVLPEPWVQISVVWVLAELFLLFRVLHYYPCNFSAPSVQVSHGVDDQAAMTQTYLNMFGTEFTHGTYFWALADAAGMNIISKCACEYELYAMRLEISLLKDALEKNAKADVEQKSAKLAFTLRIAVKVFQGRLLLSGILRTLLPMLVQLTLLSLNKILYRGNAAQVMFSFCSSLFTALMMLHPLFTFMRMWRSDIKPLVLEPPCDQFNAPPMWRMYLVILLFLSLLISTTICFVMQLYCKSGLWSIFEGCFEIELSGNTSIAAI